MELDKFIYSGIKSQFDFWNKERLINKQTGKPLKNQPVNPIYSRVKRQRETLISMLKRKTRNTMLKDIRKIRVLSHQIRSTGSKDPQRKKLRFFYCRYADDWIILFNGTQHHANKLKELI